MQFRLEKLSEQLREEISSLVFGEKVKDPRVTKFLSINRVELSPDLSWAKVFVSSFLHPNETKRGVVGLQNAAGFIQTTLSKKLKIRQFPKLEFVFDESIKDSIEMRQTLESLVAPSEIPAPRPKKSNKGDDYFKGPKKKNGDSSI